MQFLALASGALTLALLLAILTTNENSRLTLGSQILATVSVAAFFLGFAPPQLLRIGWRKPEQARLQQAIASLLTFAESQEEVASRVLEPAAAIVGARAIAIRNAEGRVVAAWNVPHDAWTDLERKRQPPALWEDAEIVDLEVPGGSLVVWTSPYAPFFGDEELAVLRTLGALTGLALDRVRLFQAEHESRIALERAHEVNLNFIALAAHELRTPVTTVHGFVTTLHHLSRPAQPRTTRDAPERAAPADAAHGLTRRAATRPLAPRRRDGRDRTGARAGALTGRGDRQRRRSTPPEGRDRRA